ncbi:MAG: putative C-S lyase [Epsilonproteobacteria bacterium]|nr:putative C-S lyase [Campylobacterota bacterium]
MAFDFSTSHCRKDTNAEKYALREKLFGTHDVLPAWVADMDIDTPPCVLKAVREKLEQRVMGYEEVPLSLFETQSRWMRERYGAEYDPELMLYSHSVVATMNAIIEAFTQKGDGVIVQTPVYPPFFHSVLEHERELIKNPLRQNEEGIYEMDFEDLESKITPSTKLLLLCNPHNPVGRAWRNEELERLLAICKKHEILIFSDEVHCDLVFAPHIHMPLLNLKGAKERVITAIGVGKTFNMAGFAISSIVFADSEIKEQFMPTYKKIHFAQGSSLSHAACESAYEEGGEWLAELKLHLQKNHAKLYSLCERYSHAIKLHPLEATYLAWLDCRGMGLRDRELRDFFIYEAKLGLSAGISFSREGSGFMRLNFALADDKMSLLLGGLESALKKRFGESRDTN